MRFPGYWVSSDSGRVVLEKTVFDETELESASLGSINHTMRVFLGVAVLLAAF
jgi:hypothetical protein